MLIQAPLLHLQCVDVLCGVGKHFCMAVSLGIGRQARSSLDKFHQGTHSETIRRRGNCAHLISPMPKAAARSGALCQCKCLQEYHVCKAASPDEMTDRQFMVQLAKARTPEDRAKVDLKLHFMKQTLDEPVSPPTFSLPFLL